MRQNFWKKFMTGALAGLATGIMVLILTGLLFEQFFFRIESQTYDWRVRRAVEAPQTPLEDIIIIDIDERTIQKLGSYYQWPRDYWIKLIDFLSQSSAACIGPDIIFDPNPRHPEEDIALQKAFSRAGNICSAFYFSLADEQQFRPAMVNEPENLDYRRFIRDVPENLLTRLLRQDRFEPTYPGFLNAGLTAGYVNLFPDPDGVLRRIPALLRFNHNVYPAFSVQIALKLMNITRIDYDEGRSRLILDDAEGNSREIPIDAYGQMLISYVGGFNSFRYISFYDVLMGFVPSEYFTGKTILIGSSLPGFYDLRSTPLQPAYPGVEVNANVIHQLLKGNFIYQLTGLQKFMLVILFSIFCGALLIFPRPIGSIIITVASIFFILLGGLYFLEKFSIWLPVVPLFLSVTLAFAMTYVYRYIFEERDKRQIRKIFSHYVSPAVVELLLKHPDKVKLGGEKKTCTVLFSDIVGFTTIAESMEPTKLVHLLNDYLTAMTNIIFNHKGMLDKYEGDAIMAVFGAPMELPESPELACDAALDMQKQLQLLRDFWKKIDRPLFHMRVGINTGDMIVGNMGSESRFDYTVVGDAVNLASRLESANQMYGTRIMVGEQTFESIQNKFSTRPLDLLRVKGKKNPVRVYELISRLEEPLPLEYTKMIDEFKEGFKNYLLKNWDEAVQHFQKALHFKEDDGPSRLYLERCKQFHIAPPGPDWDGVFVMKTK